MKKPFSISSTIRLFITGFGMGTADLVPGVSGGTIAFLSGIYEELLYSIKLISGKVLKTFLQGNIVEAIRMVPFSFLVPLAFGLFSAILVLSKVFAYLFEFHAVVTWSFFFGLVLASTVVVAKRITKWSFVTVGLFLISAVAAYILVGAVPVETPNTLLFFFLSGMIAICAMILPGISGSFMLLLMGKYQQLLAAVNSRDVLTLLVFMLGAAVGISLFSRLLTYLFAKYHNILVSILAGFMLGSIRKIWPYKEVLITRVNSHGDIVPVVEANILPALNAGVLFALLFVVAGFFLVMWMDKFQLTKEQHKDIEDKDFKKIMKEAESS